MYVQVGLSTIKDRLEPSKPISSQLMPIMDEALNIAKGIMAVAKSAVHNHHLHQVLLVRAQYPDQHHVSARVLLRWYRMLRPVTVVIQCIQCELRIVSFVAHHMDRIVMCKLFCQPLWLQRFIRICNLWPRRV